MSAVLTTQEQKDAAKIAARRAREADRVARMIHDPFNRQIGIPLQDIERQIKEKQERQALAANQAQEELEQQRRLAALLEAQEVQRREEERATKAQLQASWNEARQLKADQREKEQRRNKNAVARSSMKFVGEDPLRGERRKMQQIQMKRWIMQQQAVKAQQAEKDSNADNKYLRGLAALQEIADRAEQEKQAEARRVAMEVRNENLMAARLKREQSSRERKRSLRGAGALVAADETRNGRGAEFRGLTPAQRQQIADENARLVLEARQRKQREQEEKAAYGQMLRAQATYAERSELEAAAAAKQRHAELQAALQQQQYDAQAQRRAQERRDRKAPFQNGFFDGFGKTSR